MSKGSLLAAVAEGERLLLDTTVLAAYLDATDATHGVARYILRDMVEPGRNPAAISMVTVMELLVRPMRSVPSDHHTVIAFLRTFPNLVCIPVDLQVAQDAAQLRADRRMSPPDALIVGTALAAQVRHVVTNDRAWSSKLATMSERLSVVLASAHLPLP